MAIRLQDISTLPPEGFSKKEARKATRHYTRLIGAYHHRMLARKKENVLIIFQSMDAGGKDGAVRKVFRHCTHDCMRVAAFKKPTEEEFAHDFLWRVHKQVPRRGEWVIFNRSHYEDILIQWVHRWIDDTKREYRMRAINDFERLLQQDNDTIILKFYLHISLDEQERQLRERIEDPTKRWKHNDNDWKERAHWDRYMEAYEYAINHSTVPWHIIPVDRRWYRDYLVSKTIVETLEKLDLPYPFEDADPFSPKL